jgi:hypothetical protein
VTLNGAVLFHSLLFAYHKKMREFSGPDAAASVLPFLEVYLDRSDYTRFTEAEDFDAIDILENFGELLVESHLIQSYEVLRTKEGLRFAVRGCVFARKVHGLLDPRDVSCPFGMLASSLIEKKYGKSVADVLSTFTEFDSETDIKLSSNNVLTEDLLSWAGVAEGVEI